MVKYFVTLAEQSSFQRYNAASCYNSVLRSSQNKDLALMLKIGQPDSNLRKNILTFS